MPVPARKQAILAATLLCLFHGLLAVAQCESCSAEYDESAFDLWQNSYNPYSVGLPVGAQAPPLPGFGVPGDLALLLAIDTSCNPEYLSLVELWSRELPELRVVALLTGLSRGLKASTIDTLGPAVDVIAEPLSTVLCAQYQVGDRASPVTFLIDRNGTIVYRRWSFSNRTAMEFDGIVRYFAQTSELPEATLLQQVQWYGDQVQWPAFPLRDGEGDEVFLKPGRPLLLYSGSDAGRDAPAYSDLASMIEEYDEHIDFVLLVRTLTEEDSHSIWTFGRLVGLDAVHPEWYALDFDEFLAKGNLLEHQAQLEEQEQRASEDGWRVLYDDRWRLGFLWLLYAAPSVTIVDADGVLVFPCTTYPVNSLTGEYVAAEGAAEELRGILDGLLPLL